MGSFHQIVAGQFCIVRVNWIVCCGQTILCVAWCHFIFVTPNPQQFLSAACKSTAPLCPVTLPLHWLCHTFSYQIHSTPPPHLHPSLTAFHLRLLRAEKCSEGKVTSNFLSMSLSFIRDDFLYNLLEDLHLHCAFDPMSLLSPQGHCSGSFFSLFYLQHQIFLFDWIILVSMHTHTALHMILNKKIKQTRTSKKKKKLSPYSGTNFFPSSFLFFLLQWDFYPHCFTKTVFVKDTDKLHTAKAHG